MARDAKRVTTQQSYTWLILCMRVQYKSLGLYNSLSSWKPIACNRYTRTSHYFSWRKFIVCASRVLLLIFVVVVIAAIWTQQPPLVIMHGNNTSPAVSRAIWVSSWALLISSRAPCCYHRIVRIMRRRCFDANMRFGQSWVIGETRARIRRMSISPRVYVCM